MFGEDIRVMTTNQLIDAVTRGNRCMFNRCLDTDIIKREAHPIGFHVFQVVLPFHEAFDKSLPAHHRVMGLIKLRGREEGQEVIFDISTIDWNSYMTPEVFAERNDMILDSEQVIDINA